MLGRAVLSSNKSHQASTANDVMDVCHIAHDVIYYDVIYDIIYSYIIHCVYAISSFLHAQALSTLLISFWST